MKATIVLCSILAAATLSVAAAIDNDARGIIPKKGTKPDFTLGLSPRINCKDGRNDKHDKSVDVNNGDTVCVPFGIHKSGFIESGTLLKYCATVDVVYFSGTKCAEGSEISHRVYKTDSETEEKCIGSFPEGAGSGAFKCGKVAKGE